MENKIFNTIISIVIIVFIPFLFLGIDNICLNGRYLSKFNYGEDCSFQIPKDYDIQTDGKLFIVVRKNNAYNITECLYMGRSKMWFDDKNTTKPMIFLTECNAKSALKHYFEQDKPINNNFK